MITEVEPAPALPGPLHGKRLLVKDLFDTAGIRTTYGSKIYADHVPTRTAPAVAAARRRGGRDRRQGEPARVRVGRDEPEPVVRHGAQPGASGAHDGRLVGRQRRRRSPRGSATSASAPTPAARSGFRPHAATSSGSSRQWGRIPTEGVFPLCPSYDTVGPMATSVADVALMWSALTGDAVPEPRLDGLTIGLLTRPPSVGGAAAEENRSAEQYVAQLEALGARVVETTIPDAPGDTWPLFFHEAAESHRATFPVAARTSTATTCARSSSTHRRSIPTTSRERAKRCGAGARTGRTSTSTSRRRSASRSRRRTATSSTCGSPCTAFLRPFNVLGWAGLAIGDLQFVAPTRRGRPRRRPRLGACRDVAGSPTRRSRQPAEISAQVSDT